MTTGQKVRAARLNMGRDFTQAKLAEALTGLGWKVTRAYVGNLETDRAGRLDAKRYALLGKVFNLPDEYFEEEEGDNVPSALPALYKAAIDFTAARPIDLGELPKELQEGIAAVAKKHFSSVEGAALFLIKAGLEAWTKAMGATPDFQGKLTGGSVRDGRESPKETRSPHHTKS